MAVKPIISKVIFRQVPREGSLVGFVDFTFKEDFSLTNVAVHQLLDKSGFRLVYPQKKDNSKPFVFPNNKKTQQQIDKIVNEHLNQGALNDKSASPATNSIR